MIKIEDILDDAVRYLKGEMDEYEKDFFETLLKQYPHLQEDLRMINLASGELREIKRRENNSGLFSSLLLSLNRASLGKRAAWTAAVTLLILAVVCFFPKSNVIEKQNGQVIRYALPAKNDGGVHEAIKVFGGDSELHNSNRGKSVCWLPSGDIAFAAIYQGRGRLGPYHFSSDSTLDIVFGKYNLASGYEWVRPLGSKEGRDLPQGIAADESGNILLTGTFGGRVNFGGRSFQSIGIGNVGPSDFFLAKYTPSGDLLWVKHAGGKRIAYEQTGNNFGLAVTSDADNNVLFTAMYVGAPVFEGDTLPIGGPNEESLIAKFSPDGQLEWTQTITGDYMVHPFDIQTDSYNNVYVTGDFGHHNLGGRAFFGKEQVLSTRGGRDIFLAKYSSEGELLWVRQAGSAQKENGHDYARSLAIDRNGNCIIAGEFVGSTIFQQDTLPGYGGRDIFVAKYDPNGQLIWVKQAGSPGGSGPKNESANAVTVTDNGSIFITGNFTGTALFGTDTLTTGDISNCFIAKLTLDGEFLWAKQFEPLNGAEEAEGRSIDVNPQGELVVTGFFSGRFRIGNTPLNSNGKEDVFILLFDENGNLRSARSMINFS